MSMYDLTTEQQRTLCNLLDSEHFCNATSLVSIALENDDEARDEIYDYICGGADEGDNEEPYEYHLVSKWFAERINNSGGLAVVVGGMHVWCRFSTGFSITHDYVCHKALADLLGIEDRFKDDNDDDEDDDDTND